MNIQAIEGCTLLKLSNIEGMDDYTSIAVTVNINCCDSYSRILYTGAANQFMYVDEAGNLFIKPKFLSTGPTNIPVSFPDGVYTITVKVNRDGGGFVQQQMCTFVDCATKCKVATYIKGLLDRDETATNVHMLHYALTNDGNCGCNCQDLCDVYNYLNKLISNVKIENCGCQ